MNQPNRTTSFLPNNSFIIRSLAILFATEGTLPFLKPTVVEVLLRVLFTVQGYERIACGLSFFFYSSYNAQVSSSISLLRIKLTGLYTAELMKRKLPTFWPKTHTAAYAHKQSSFSPCKKSSFGSQIVTDFDFALPTVPQYVPLSLPLSNIHNTTASPLHLSIPSMPSLILWPPAQSCSSLRSSFSPPPLILPPACAVTPAAVCLCRRREGTPHWLCRWASSETDHHWREGKTEEHDYHCIDPPHAH